MTTTQPALVREVKVHDYLVSFGKSVVVGYRIDIDDQRTNITGSNAEVNYTVCEI